MKASELIVFLQQTIVEHGDLDCTVRNSIPSGDEIASIAPRVAYEKIMAPRERTQKYWESWRRDEDNDKLRGRKIVRIA